MLALVGMVACGEESGSPMLSDIEPARVINNVATPAALHGVRLFGHTRFDLDRGTASAIDQTWQVRIGDAPVEVVTWVDPTRIDLVIPSGLLAGTYAVTAISPAGDEITVPNLLEVVDPEQMMVATELIAANPFGDGTPFAYVAGYRGMVYLGPSADGTAAVRFAPDSLALELVTFSFTVDSINNSTRNDSRPYTSIGATGCVPDTAACGPDNEDGRGRFAAGTLAGTEVLILGGARSGGDLDYVYATTDTDAVLDFRHVDLDSQLGGETKGVSAIHPHGNRLYMGFPDSGGSRPYALSLQTLPPVTGLDAEEPTDVTDLKADTVQGIRPTGVTIIDTIADANTRLFFANAAVWVRAAVDDPKKFDTNDWTIVTPTAAAYAAKPSRFTTKLSDLEPPDRAVPQVAELGGRVFVGRNTVDGPQLWACDRAATADPAQCDSGDWVLVAANSAGDPLLTQFDDVRLTSITMVVATPTHLYVGFDSAAGLSVFRTANPLANTRADFEGDAGCSATQYPASCVPIGKAGFGVPTQQRIFDATALTFSNKTTVYVTVGDGTSALSLYALR